MAGSKHVIWTPQAHGTRSTSIRKGGELEEYKRDSEGSTGSRYISGGRLVDGRIASFGYGEAAGGEGR